MERSGGLKRRGTPLPCGVPSLSDGAVHNSRGEWPLRRGSSLRVQALSCHLFMDGVGLLPQGQNYR